MPPAPSKPWEHNYTTKEEMLLSLGTEPKHPHSKEGIEGHVKPIVALYREQRAMKINSHDHPRGEALKQFLLSRIKQRVRADRENYADRGLNTILDGYTDKIPEMCSFLMSQSSCNKLK